MQSSEMTSRTHSEMIPVLGVSQTATREMQGAPHSMNFWQGSQRAFGRGRNPSSQCDSGLATPNPIRLCRRIENGAAMHAHAHSVELSEFTAFQASDVRQVQQRGLAEGSCTGTLARDFHDRGTENSTCNRDITCHRTRRALVHENHFGKGYPSTENLCRINSGKKKTVAA